MAPERKLSPTIVGVLNITPDSFSDGGVYLDPLKALTRAQELIAEGAAIVELGGESTAPGSQPITAEEEWSRLRPAIEKFSEVIPFGVDTYKSDIARKAIAHGASLINDVSCGNADSELARVVADSEALLVLMHSKEKGALPHVSDSQKDYQDLIREIGEALLFAAEQAMRCGVHKTKIVLDPGMGRFISHDPRYSYELLGKFDELVKAVAPFPVMVATSRKGFLGGKLSERDPISQYTALIAVEKGAQLVRTHRPDMMQEFLRIQNAIHG